MIWRDELLAQLDFYWDYHLWPRLEGLTDEEYFWEPVKGCWSIRPQADGTVMIDWSWPTPEPPPVTTIGWRLAHIAIGVFGLRANDHFGDGSLNITNARWPGSAEQALTMLERNYHAWCSGVRGMDDAALTGKVGPAEKPWDEHSYAGLVLHLSRETMHHGGEIGALRDLYRAQFTAR